MATLASRTQDLYRGAEATIASAMSSSTVTSTPFLIALGVVLLAFIIWYVIESFAFETPTNILRKEAAAAKAMSVYEGKTRLSLSESLSKYKSAGESDDKDTFLFSNFYWYTANMGAMFFSDMQPVSSVPRVIVSPKAARLALLGGARCFVFDVWPDLTPGDGQFSPIVQTVEEGSAWRRSSFNAVPLAAILSVLMKEAYEVGRASTQNDPIMLYLRFKGVPRKSTFDYTARVLESTIQPYRLDASYNRCRGQQLIPTQNIQVFKRQVIVASNVTAQNSVLGDYINIGPSAGISLEYNPNFAKGLTTDMKNTAIQGIKQNISFVAPDDMTNGWDLSGCASLGIHCLALNFGTLSIPATAPTYNAVTSGRAADVGFDKVSFLLKPKALRLQVSSIPAPSTPPDFKFNGGNITQPKGISIPQGF